MARTSHTANGRGSSQGPLRGTGGSPGAGAVPASTFLPPTSTCTSETHTDPFPADTEQQTASPQTRGPGLSLPTLATQTHSGTRAQDLLFSTLYKSPRPPPPHNPKEHPTPRAIPPLLISHRPARGHRPGGQDTEGRPRDGGGQRSQSQCVLGLRGGRDGEDSVRCPQCPSSEGQGAVRGAARWPAAC